MQSRKCSLTAFFLRAAEIAALVFWGVAAVKVMPLLGDGLIKESKWTRRSSSRIGMR